MPEVCVEFKVEDNEFKFFSEDKELLLPAAFKAQIAVTQKLWVTKNLVTQKYFLETSLSRLLEDKAEGREEITTQELLDQVTQLLYETWPTFLFFDAFDQYLPREILVSQVCDADGKLLTSCPQAVKDFIALSKLDLVRLQKLALQDKALLNYLSQCDTTITSDFLSFWGSNGINAQNTQLSVKYHRDQNGELKLSFYITDHINQYADQRSKGFGWFLAFYLRLAANTNKNVVLLIDEPGSYLHARAQKDVLNLFESRISKAQTVIYSTHSPFLLPANRLHRVRAVVKKSDKGTLVLDRLTSPELTEDQKDTLTPIISSIGIDIHEVLSFRKNYSVVVEGFSDFLYLSTWSQLFNPDFQDEVNIFPGSGSGTIQTLASLLTGWGFPFSIMMDRDRPKDKQNLLVNFGLSEAEFAHPTNGQTIEDIFSHVTFAALLNQLGHVMIPEDKTPSAAIKRLRLDKAKVLIARTFAESVQNKTISVDEETTNKATSLLSNIIAACKSAKDRRLVK